MSVIVYVLIIVLEILLAIRNCKKGTGKKTQSKNRLTVRGVQAAVLIIAILIPAGQKWRFIPALIILAILLIIAAMKVAARRRKEGSPRKTAGIIVSCVINILLFGLLLIPAFVFTGYKGLPVSGEYEIRETSAILIDESRTDPFEQDGSFREVPVHFYYPAVDAGNTEKFPMAVFSHGAFGYYQSNTSTYMELASNGYVVAALDHPHHAFFTEDTDGKMVLVDQGFLNTALATQNESITENEAEEQLKVYQDWMSLRTADMNYAVDELIAAANENAVDDSWFLPEKNSDEILAMLSMTDVSKIGLMGHSMGGATSVALGRERSEISAVIDIDGTMLSEYTGVADGKFTVNEEPYETPVLEFVNWESYNEMAEHMEEYRAEGGRYPNDELMRHAAAGFSTTVRDTKHMDFTDLPMLSPFLGNMLGSGDRDTKETMMTVNSLVLKFCDCYLKGEGTFSVEESY